VKAIRSQITHLFGPAAAKKVRVLYGGSVTADNAKTFLNAEGVDGLLVGGASLNVHSFADIVSAGVETDSKRKHK
jgi:triosephosphate isomerase